MKNLPFIILIIITIFLGVATFAEKLYGTEFATQHYYCSWWMMTLWAATLIIGLYICITNLRRNRKPALLLHFSFGFILLGALITFTTSKRGQIHLREEGMIESTIDLPFTVNLDKFEMDYYAGTMTPVDYISHISVHDGEKELKAIVSMNNIFKYRGFRFYQASYDNDQKGTILSVSYDPFGIAVTYFGYFLMIVSMIWILFSKNSNFRKLIKTLSIIILLIIPTSSFAQRTLTKEEAKVFGELSMSYNGRIVPIDTYAHDFTMKITGKTSYKKFNAVQVLAGWMFFPEDWAEEPMIKIKNEKIKHFISDYKHSGNYRLSDFFSAGNIYKLQYANLPEQHKGIRETDEKISLIIAQKTGETLTIFPQKNQWFSCTDDLSNILVEDTVFVSKIFFMIRETLKTENHELATRLFHKISEYQYKRATKGTISPQKTKLEIFYNRFDITGILFKINLTLGFIAFGLFIRTLLTKKKNMAIKSLFYLQLIISFVLLTMALGIRWYISEHIPMSNGYETMMFVAWCVLLITFLIGKRSELIPAAGLILSGFALLVSSLGAMNPQITQLVPVLMSPLLSIHVSLLMVSYSLLGFMMFNGLTAIVLYFTVKNRDEHIAKLETISRVILYPALFTLTIGIFIGAVWANVSWGRYWGWDPKEVWALITMLVYSFAMHDKSLPIFRKPMFFHVFTIVAFLTVLMTYFGVSMFLGGMHSY